MEFAEVLIAQRELAARLGTEGVAAVAAAPSPGWSHEAGPDGEHLFLLREATAKRPVAAVLCLRHGAPPVAARPVARNQVVEQVRVLWFPREWRA